MVFCAESWYTAVWQKQQEEQRAVGMPRSEDSERSGFCVSALMEAVW